MKRLTQKLFTLVVLCAALATISLGSAPRKAGASYTPFCWREVDGSGECVKVCCDDVGCFILPC